MTGFSAMLIGAALDAYDFSWLAGKTLVYVAGGQGMVLTEILRKYPSARGILFDLARTGCCRRQALDRRDSPTAAQWPTVTFLLRFPKATRTS